jgi:hypothetical protein
MNRFAATIAVFVLLCLPAALVVAASKAEFRQKDVQLFRVKCGLCHGLNKTFEAFPGMSVKERAGVVEEMAGKKNGWISDPERAAIQALLATGDLAGLVAAVERPKASAPKPAAEPTPIAAPAPIALPPPALASAPIVVPNPVPTPTPVMDPLPDEDAGEAGIELIPIAHGVAMAAVFFVLGIAMALSGLKRFFEKRRILPRFPGTFVWQRHVLKGKIYIACALGGLGVGLSIWALDGFSIGALPHFAIGCGVGLLFAAGGAAGLRMARGKGTPALRRLHAICNLAATALYTINFVSGLSLVWPLFTW